MNIKDITKGQKLRCINNVRVSELLTVGKEYEVLYIQGDTYVRVIADKHGSGGFLPTRFEAVPKQAEVAAPKRKEQTIGGITYEQHAQFPGLLCIGCAGQKDDPLCADLGECRGVIWVEKARVHDSVVLAPQPYKPTHGGYPDVKRVFTAAHKDVVSPPGQIVNPEVRARGVTAEQASAAAEAERKTSPVVSPQYTKDNVGTARVAGKRNKTTIRTRVLDFIHLNGPATGKEIAAGTGIPLNSVTPRFAQLTAAGKLKDSGRTRDGQIVWTDIT